MGDAIFQPKRARGFFGLFCWQVVDEYSGHVDQGFGRLLKLEPFYVFSDAMG